MTLTADVSTCSVESCSYNHDEHCAADAITVGGSNGHATCATFVSLDSDGGLPTVRSHVGACQRSDCAHNRDLMCSAESVTIGWSGAEADCLTYTTA